MPGSGLLRNDLPGGRVSLNQSARSLNVLNRSVPTKRYCRQDRSRAPTPESCVELFENSPVPLLPDPALTPPQTSAPKPVPAPPPAPAQTMAPAPVLTPAAAPTQVIEVNEQLPQTPEIPEVPVEPIPPPPPAATPPQAMSPQPILFQKSPAHATSATSSQRTTTSGSYRTTGGRCSGRGYSRDVRLSSGAGCC